MKEWYSAIELAGLPGMPETESGVIRKARTDKIRFQDVQGKGGPGGKRREYHLSALPEETRSHLLTESTQPAFNNDLNTYLTSKRISLSPAELQDPVVQAKITCARAYGACPAYKGREKLLASLAARYEKSIPTIRRWISDIDKLRARSRSKVILGEPASLNEKVELPASHTFTPEALAYGLAIYSKNMRGGMKAAYRQMELIASERGWTIGDYSNFTRAVKRIPEAVWTRIYRGATGFELACVPKIVREWTAVPVQSVLCGDQKIFDHEVYDPELSRVIIPNGYFWMDCSSRMVTGVWLEMGHYNSYTVGNALREALRYGIPDEIFTDWGKPEGAKHIGNILSALSGHSQTGDFIHMAERFGDMCADDVEHRKAQPGKPWMKPIENIMNILDTMMDARFIGGYRKRNNDAWVNKQCQAMLKRDRRITFQSSRQVTASEAKGLMNIEEFTHTVFSVVEEHNRTQKKLQEGGVIIPGEYFARGITSQHRPVLDDATLNYICMPRVDRIPRQSVVKLRVRHDDERGYYSPALSGIKERVRISYNPYDREEPAVITTLDGKYLDLGQPWHVQSPYDRAGIAAKRTRQAELMKWVGEQARRVKSAFDIVMEDAAPVHTPAAVPTRIIPASMAAHEAEREKKIYKIREDNTTLHDRETAREANALRDELQRQFQTVSGNASFEPPPEGKQRYICWLDLNDRSSSGAVLSREELMFLANYPDTADYRNEKKFHEKHGDLYITRTGITQATGGLKAGS